MQTSTSKNSVNLLTGVLFVLFGAASYGMLSTFVKLAYKDGFTTAEVTCAQFLWGFAAFGLLRFFPAKGAPRANGRDVRNLILAGTSLGATSVLYYAAVSFINASIGVVLLMQSIWMGVLFECALTKKWPAFDKVIAIVLVLFGTLLATNSIGVESADLDIRGVIFGLLAAFSFSCTMAATGSIAPHLPTIKRSEYMLYGGAVVVGLFALLTQFGPHYLGIVTLPPDFTHDKSFDPNIFKFYGLFLAVFGTILPPILLNKGFPITGVALGSIISSVELPFAVMISWALLGEPLTVMQLTGVAVIVLSVLLLNYRAVRRN